MSQKLTCIAGCAVIVLGVSITAFSEDSARALPGNAPSDTIAAVSMVAASASSQPLHFSKDTSSDSATLAAKSRDSTVRTMLAELEHEASLKALAQDDSAPSATTARSKPNGIISAIRRSDRTVLFAATGIAVFLIGLIIAVVARGRSDKDSRRFMTTTRLSLMNSEVQRACLHIEKYYMDTGLSPEVVCTAIITGEPFLEVLFEKELGISITGYINQVRIHRAKLIVGRNSAIESTEIAPQVGFSDVGTFETQFKAVAGSDFDTFRREKQAAL